MNREETGKCVELVRSLIPGLKPGFTVITDLGRLTHMDLDCAQDLITVMEATWFGRRYDFECEAGIRLCWRGLPVINVPTPVRYLTKAEGGVSHYHYVRDNVRLVTLFLRHFPAALLRCPLLLARRISGKSRVGPVHGKSA